MNKKKKYQAPAFEVIKLKSRPCLLNDSVPAEEDPNNPNPDPD